jgi:hypothetical protein
MITDDHKTTRTAKELPMTPISSRKTSIDTDFPVIHSSPITPTYQDTFPESAYELPFQKSIPILNHILPTDGPTTGGTKITITGDQFHPGLTLMVGHRAAKTLSCTSTTMVCLLPMAEASGPVILSFKEHPLMRASPIPPIFEYCETARLDLLQLVLQSVPIEHTDDMEFDVLQALASYGGPVSATNLKGQTMLHFAAHLNYPRLMSVLVARHPTLVDVQDINGLSPLHVACNAKSTVVIEILLKAGADIGLLSNLGTPIQLAMELLTVQEYRDFEKRLADIHTLNPFTVSWLPDLFGKNKTKQKTLNILTCYVVYACFQYNQRALDYSLLYHL